MIRLARGSVLGGALLASGCQGSTATVAQLPARMASAPEELVGDADRPLEAPPLPPISAPEEAHPLLGARHDLAYAGPPSDVCRCLAVRVEQSAEAPALRWAVAPPQLDGGSQWVVALSSQGVRCDGAPPGSRGASYQGYETRGGDVIVFVEALGEGHPLTSGGIIPKPAPGGSVFVEALGSVYGKPLQGDQARCKVPAPTVAAGPLAAAENPMDATDAPASGVRFAQSPAAPPAASDAAPVSLVLSGADGSSPAVSSRSPQSAARTSATATARPINDGCDDSKYWTDKAGIRRIKPQCL